MKGCELPYIGGRFAWPATTLRTSVLLRQHANLWTGGLTWRKPEALVQCRNQTMMLSMMFHANTFVLGPFVLAGLGKV